MSMLKAATISLVATVCLGMVLAVATVIQPEAYSLLLSTGLLVWWVIFYLLLPDYSVLQGRELKRVRFRFGAFLVSSLFLLIVGNAVLLRFYPTTGNDTVVRASKLEVRDECASELRGIAEMNARLQGFTVAKIHSGQFFYKSNGNVSCEARFLILKDGISDVSKLFMAEVAPNKN